MQSFTSVVIMIVDYLTGPTPGVFIIDEVITLIMVLDLL